MSRIGKLAIKIPDQVTVHLSEDSVTVKGPRGELQRQLPPDVGVVTDNGMLQVQCLGESRRARAMHGLARALLQNMVTGVDTGFTRILEINGVGYRAEAKPGLLALSIGYSHPIEVVLPDGVTAKVEKNRIELFGIDREKVGQTAAVIRDQRPPEPYKGKGIKYLEEVIRRKVGKAGAA